MSSPHESGIEPRITALLEAANLSGGFPSSLVCTDQGLLVATAGEAESSESYAAIASLFDEVVTRARRDLHRPSVDELTLRDLETGRLVIRPIAEVAGTRMLLAIRVPRNRLWRRVTNGLLVGLRRELKVFEEE